MRLALAVVVLFDGVGCGFIGVGSDPDDGGEGGGGGKGADTTPVPDRLDYLTGFPRGEEQRQILCARGNQDRFARYYCTGAQAPTVTGLNDLLVALRLKNPNAPQTMNFAMQGHSSSLVVRKTSSINPRAIIFDPSAVTATPQSDYITFGIVRGDNFAEIAAFDVANQRLNFYLLRFDRPCEPNCGNAERFTAALESNWQAVHVYGDQDLKNNALDCLRCHQPGGPSTARMLRMHELDNPWTHFLNNQRGSRVLLADFLAAHTEAEYAGVTRAQIAAANDNSPRGLENFLRAVGFGVQPNEFLGRVINNDTAAVTTPSATWLALYDTVANGNAIPIPYFAINPFDRARVASATSAYRAVVSGQAAPETMPDMADVFLEDAAGYLGFGKRSSGNAEQVAARNCGSCHNDRLTEGSRANFRHQNILTLSPAMRAKVRDRLRRPLTDHERMPPEMSGTLSAEDLATLEAAVAE